MALYRHLHFYVLLGNPAIVGMHTLFRALDGQRLGPGGEGEADQTADSSLHISPLTPGAQARSRRTQG